MKEMLTKNLGLKILSIFMAAFLWLLVVNISDPIDTRIFRGVNVTVQHGEVITNTGKTYQVSDETKTVSVVVEAKGSVLKDIKQEDIIAIADIRELELQTMVPVTVSINGLESYEYESATATPRNIQISVEDSERNNFPVTVATEGTVRDGYVIAKTTPVPDSIQVDGPKSLVSKISRVVAKADVSGLSRPNNRIAADIIMYNADDEIIDQFLLGKNLKDGEAFVDVELYSTKTVPVQINTAGIEPAEGYTLSGLVYEPQTMEVYGPDEALQALETLQIPASAMELKEIGGREKLTIDILEYLPENIKLVDENANLIAVTVSVTPIGTTILDIPVASIEIKNASEDLIVSYGDIEDIQVGFQGSEEVLNSLTQSKVKASIDLKGKKAGTHDVPVQFIMPEGVELMNEITAPVILEKRE